MDELEASSAVRATASRVAKSLVNEPTSFTQERALKVLKLGMKTIFSIESLFNLFTSA